MKFLLGEGLITSDGELHLRQRRLIQPEFHKRRIAAYSETMTRFSEAHIADWRDGAALDMSEEMTELTLKIVAKTLFNSETPSEVDRIRDAITIANEYLVMRGLNPLGKLLHRLPLPSTRRFHRAAAALDSMIYRLIEERQASGADSGDLLSMLIMLRDEESGAGMSHRQVRDEAITFFAAGHETTANALIWTWYLLSQHPDMEAKLHAELDSALNGRTPSMDDLPNLVYTEQVLTESMRLYTPVWGTSRIAINDVEIGGYPIQKGSLVFVSQYVTHRDPRWYSDPLEFRPERWTPEFKASLPRYAYFPFGGGPRQCIGEPFAWMEGVLLLATIAKSWTMRLDQDYSLELDPLITLRPRYGMPMRVFQHGPKEKAR
jgi:cytochrome P450